MKYTLKQLQNVVSRLIAEQGENAHCAAWIYTKNDCHTKAEGRGSDSPRNVEDPEILKRIFVDVGNTSYIDRVIQGSVNQASAYFVQE